MRNKRLREMWGRTLRPAKAGLQPGDVFLKIGDAEVMNPAQGRRAILSHAPGDPLKLQIKRGEKKLDFTATLAALSTRPAHTGAERAIIGLRMGTASDTTGIPVSGVTIGKPAALAGIKAGDTILKVNDADLGESLSLADKLFEYRPGDSVKLTVRRQKEVYGTNPPDGR